MAVRILCVFAGCLLLSQGAALAAPDEVETCASCHGEDGSGVGLDDVPIIAGTPAPHLEEALFAYKDGARRCVEVALMCETVTPLPDDVLSALAEYYASKPRAASGEPFDSKQAAEGKLVHDELCAQCHVLPTDPDVADAIGIPLNGQKAAYLRLALKAYLDGDRETLVPVMADRLRQLDPARTEALINYYASWNPQP